MKVVIDIRSSEGKRAGKGFYTYFLTQALIKHAPEIQFILLSQNGISGFENFKNVEVHRIKSKSIFWHISAIKFLKKSKVDIYFAPSSFIVPAFIPKDIRLFTTIHDLVAFIFPNTHNRKAKYVEKFLIKRVLKKSDFILGVSQNTINDVKKLFNVNEKKLKVVYCSASDNFKADKSIKKEKFFLAVSTISPRKNFENLLKAFDKIRDLDENLRLKIVGGKGWQYEKVFEIIDKLRLKSKVDILGYVSDQDLIKIYNKAIALVFPSFYEGFGIPPLEAMKSGCPVICSKNSSLPEVVGDAAKFIDPYDTDDIALAMKDLLTNSDLRSNLSKKGLLQAKNFSFDKSAKKLLKLFKKSA